MCSSVVLPVQERQLQSHAGMLESFKADLSYLQQNLPEGKKAKAKELEEHRVRAEYLQHEVIKVLWVKVCVQKCKKNPQVTPSILFKPRRCAAMRSISRGWRPGRAWRRQATAHWASQTWACLIKPCVRTPLGMKMRRTAGWKSPTPAPLWRQRRLLRRWSKSDATSQKDGLIAGPSSLDGIKRPERFYSEITRPVNGPLKTQIYLCCELTGLQSFTLWKHLAEKHQSHVWNLPQQVYCFVLEFFCNFVLCTFTEINLRESQTLRIEGRGLSDSKCMDLIYLVLLC